MLKGPSITQVSRLGQIFDYRDNETGLALTITVCWNYNEINHFNL